MTGSFSLSYAVICWLSYGLSYETVFTVGSARPCRGAVLAGPHKILPSSNSFKFSKGVKEVFNISRGYDYVCFIFKFENNRFIR